MSGATKQRVTESEEESPRQDTSRGNAAYQSITGRLCILKMNSTFTHSSCPYLPSFSFHAENPTAVPLLRDLANEVIPKVCSIWRKLGTQLNLNQWDLDAIEANHRKVEDCCTTMFTKWLSQEPEASWSTLVSALRTKSVDMPELAASLEEMYINPHPK